MKKKRLVALAAAASLCIPVLPASASVEDSALPSKYITYSSGANTATRQKENDTYVYVKNTSGFDIRVRAKSGGVNCTKSDYARIPSRTERFVTNYVHERGYHNCYLYITADTPGVKGYLTGYWSPDSVGSYPVANP